MKEEIEITQKRVKELREKMQRIAEKIRKLEERDIRIFKKYIFLRTKNEFFTFVIPVDNVFNPEEETIDTKNEMIVIEYKIHEELENGIFSYKMTQKSQDKLKEMGFKIEHKYNDDDLEKLAIHCDEMKERR